MKLDFTALPANLVLRASEVEITGTVTGCPGIAKHSSGLAGTFTSMVQDLAKGDASSVIRYINRSTIRSDVESILGYALTREEANIAGLSCPSHIEDIALARACTIARELQAVRHMARRTCQVYQVHGTGSKALHKRLTSYLSDALDLLDIPGSDDDDGDTFETW